MACTYSAHRLFAMPPYIRLSPELDIAFDLFPTSTSNFPMDLGVRKFYHNFDDPTTTLLSYASGIESDVYSMHGQSFPSTASALTPSGASTAVVFDSERETLVKSEDAVMDGTGSCDRSVEQESDESCAKSNPIFSTQVDTLMRTIQTKSTKGQASSAPSPQLNASPHLIMSEHSVQADTDVTKRHRSRSRKSYRCSIPSCTKVFYQKTHLEIHLRAHTGHKPFVRYQDILVLFMIQKN